MGPGSAEIPSTSWHSQRFDRLNPPGREGQFESPKLGRFVSNFRIFGAKNPSLGGDQFLLFLSLNFRTLSPNQIVLRFQEFLWVVLGALTYPFHHQTDQLNQHQRGTFPRSVAWCWDGRGVHCRTERTASTQGSVYKVWSSYQSASSWSSRWLGGIKSSSCKVSGQRRCTLDWYNAHLCVCHHITCTWDDPSNKKMHQLCTLESTFFCMEALLFVCVESTFELERIRYTEATIFTYN